MYFAVGGRGTQSALYRVTYVGNESTEPVDARNKAGRDDRDQRRRLELFHGEDQANDAQPLDEIIYQMGNHDDRFGRYAARIALESRRVELWRDRILKERDPYIAVLGAIALARQGSKDDLDGILNLLGSVPKPQLDKQLYLAFLRAYQLALTRLGPPNAAQRQKVLDRLQPLYPRGFPNDEINAELARLLVYLDSPTVVSKTLAIMDRLGDEPVPDWGHLVERHKGYGGTVGRLLENMPPIRGIHFAFVLRNQKSGWTLEDRKKYLQFLIDSAKYPGGNSYAKFISQFRDDALATCSPAEKVLLDDLASVSLLAEPPKVDPPKGPGRKWTTGDALPFVQNLKKT